MRVYKIAPAFKHTKGGKMLVKSNHTCIIAIKGFSFLPTINNVPENLVSAMKKDRNFVAQLENGKFEIVDISPAKKANAKAEKKEPKILDETKENLVKIVSESTLKNAKKIISEMLNISELKEIAENDKRAAVRKAAEKQLSSIVDIAENDED